MQKSFQAGLDTADFTMVKLAPKNPTVCGVFVVLVPLLAGTEYRLDFRESLAYRSEII